MQFAQRFTGLETIFFDGGEIVSSSKLSILLIILKKRFYEEQRFYTTNERAVTMKLIDFVEDLQLLYMSQDTPLYQTHDGPAVNILADNLIYTTQVSLKVNEIPADVLLKFNQLRHDIINMENQRNFSLYRFINGELFQRFINITNKIDYNRLPGISQDINNSLDALSKFNSLIEDRFMLMLNNLDERNTLRVNIILSYIDKLESFLNDFSQERHSSSTLPSSSSDVLVSYNQSTIEITELESMAIDV